jgi:hypothetical protein
VSGHATVGYVDVPELGQGGSVKGTALICAFIGAALSAQQQPTALERAQIPSLYDLAKQARSEGKTSIVVPPPIETFLASTGLDDFVDDSMVVTAAIVSSRTLPSGSYSDRLTTWYTLRILSVIAGGRATTQSPAGSVPQSLLPLPPGELLIAVPGGRLSIDGVDIISDTVLSRQLAVGHTYLLFLEDRGMGISAAAIRGQSLGAYELRGDELRRLSSKSSPVASDIAARFHNSLVEVGQGIQALPRTKHE